MKFLYQAYIGISSFKQDIYFNKSILPVTIAPPATDWHHPPAIVDSPIWLDDIYLMGLSETATFLPRFAKSGAIARHLDRKQDHHPTNKAKHFPCVTTGHMFCCDSLNNRVNFISRNVDSPIPHSPPTTAHSPDALFTIVYKVAWPSTPPPGRNFLNLLGADCPSPRELICRATSFSHLILSLPHQGFSSQTQVVKNPSHINRVRSTIAILLINFK
jgi:hypothetical protein